MIVGIVAVPLVSAVWVSSATSRPDLSDLVPIETPQDAYALLNWSMLLRGRSPALVAGPSISTGMQIRALGYMMESGRAVPDGAWVQSFVLLPDAGSSFHPAHRFGDQMIAVHLGDGLRARFSARNLVWVWGTFRLLPGDPAGSKPLYVLEQARVRPAGMKEIPEYFR